MQTVKRLFTQTYLYLFVCGFSRVFVVAQLVQYTFFPLLPTAFVPRFSFLPPSLTSLTSHQVIRRLRERGEPIRLFGETDKDMCLRLRYTLKAYFMYVCS